MLQGKKNKIKQFYPGLSIDIDNEIFTQKCYFNYQTPALQLSISSLQLLILGTQLSTLLLQISHTFNFAIYNVTSTHTVTNNYTLSLQLSGCYSKYITLSLQLSTLLLQLLYTITPTTHTFTLSHNIAPTINTHNPASSIPAFNPTIIKCYGKVN